MYRKKLLFNYSIVTIVLAIFLIGYTFFTGFVFARYLMIISIIFIGVISYISRNFKQPFYLSNFFIGLCLIDAFLLSMFSGGVNSEVLPWFAIIPLLALLLQNRDGVLIWSVLSVVLMTLLFFTNVWVKFSPYYFDGKNILGFNYVLSISLIALITTFVLIINRLQSRIQKELNKTIANLESTEEELRQNMEELSATQEILSKTNTQLTQINDSLYLTNEDLNLTKTLLVQKKEKLEYYSTVLYKLTKSEYIQNGNLDQSLKLVLKEALTALNVTRGGVWLYVNDNNMLFCKLLSNINNDTYESGVFLDSVDYPNYFKKINENITIVADDALTNESTKEFSEAYLLPLDIKSMLDIPLFINGEAKGVICFENQVEIKHWSSEDLSFAKSITDLIAIAFQAAEKKSNSELLIKQRDEIFSKNNHLEQLSRELKEINENLDKRVKERTEQLETQSNYFAEYTFINVHLLRAPLCRVMGLTELLKFSQLNEENKDLIQKLDYEAKDLERLISKITNVLELGETINRKII
ncbi:MAG: hybrid sensor histidine kinase/response regulator [Cytophagales bacterium]|nr:MAG: hybrid sensor histidine kinase/response regulator [Cytophagales bacterium]